MQEPQSGDPQSDGPQSAEHQRRKRWALFLLVVWLPVYLIGAWWAVNWVYDRWGRLPMWVELPLYVALAFLWAVPFKRVFRGTGK